LLGDDVTEKARALRERIAKDKADKKAPAGVQPKGSDPSPKAQREREKAEAKAKEAKAKAKAEAKAKADAKIKAEAKAKAKAEREAKVKAENEAKAKAEAKERKTKAKAEAKARAEAKAKAEALASLKGYKGGGKGWGSRAGGPDFYQPPPYAPDPQSWYAWGPPPPSTASTPIAGPSLLVTRATSYRQDEQGYIYSYPRHEQRALR